MPKSAGAVVLAYNISGVDGELRLSRDAYSAIFLGEITNCNDPRIARTNPGVKLPKLTIAPVVRQDASGTTFAFTKHLDAINERWRGNFGAATVVNWPGRALRAKAMRVLRRRCNGPSAPSEMLATSSLANWDADGKKQHVALTAAEMPENMLLFLPALQRQMPIRLSFSVGCFCMEKYDSGARRRRLPISSAGRCGVEQHCTRGLIVSAVSGMIKV